MRILSHDPIHLGLLVASDKRVYEYERVPEAYVRQIRGYVRSNAIGKAWQMLRRFKLRRK